jgi:hypothetical protein
MLRYYACAHCGHTWTERQVVGAPLHVTGGNHALCNSEQPTDAHFAYSDVMRIDSWKVEIGTAWFFAVLLAGYVAGTTSMGGWTLVAAAAMTLPGIFRYFWRIPEESMSESIRDVLR